MKTFTFLVLLFFGINFLLSQKAFALGKPLPVVADSVTESIEEPIDDVSLSATRSVTPLWEAASTQGKTWTQHVYGELDSLGGSLLSTVPADASTFCPNYKNLSSANRKAYWTFVLSSMVRFESNFKPELKYTEAFNDSKGKRVISRGLLQLSIESGNAYGCGFKNENEVHDPKKNLSCGIRILNRWMANDKRIAGKVNGAWKGGARYWSVLRSTNTTPYGNIVKWSKELSICK